MFESIHQCLPHQPQRSDPQRWPLTPAPGRPNQETKKKGAVKRVIGDWLRS